MKKTLTDWRQKTAALNAPQKKDNLLAETRQLLNE